MCKLFQKAVSQPCLPISCVKTFLEKTWYLESLIKLSGKLFCEYSCLECMCAYSVVFEFALRFSELDIGFECIWDYAVRAVLRAVRCNSVRLLRSLLVHPKVISKDAKKSATAVQETVPGRKAERRAQLVVALSRARVQLDISKHLADTGVIKSLSLLDSLDASLNKSVKHLRISYSLHFPELCHNGGLLGLDNFAFASIVTYSPERQDLVKNKERLLSWLNGDEELVNKVIDLAKSSTGQKIAEDDVKTLQKYGEFLLKTLKVSSLYSKFLS